MDRLIRRIDPELDVIDEAEQQAGAFRVQVIVRLGNDCGARQ